jgi:radical SAM superfamily enzyme YgiQ (UPF0313 family)
MISGNIYYNEPVFRPPAEAYSAIIQVSLGCSWNKCAFCDMYTSKNFKIRNFIEIENDIKILGQIQHGAKKIFLADGNAFVLAPNKLIPILLEINKNFEKIQRISSYALPKDILSKTDNELKDLKNLGLKLLYIGIETGDDNLLELINKGETSKTTIEGIKKAQKAGIDTSIMIINGLGGKIYSKEHAINSAKIINEINPQFLSTLTLSFPYGFNHFQKRFKGNFERQSMRDLFVELKLFIGNIEVNNVIFRSNHISNNLELKGILNKDKEQILNELENAILNTPTGLMPYESSVL